MTIIMAIELDDRMKQVLLGIVRNKDYQTIATEMGIGISRVGNILMRVNDRLQVKGTAALTHWAIQNNLVKLGDYEK